LRPKTVALALKSVTLRIESVALQGLGTVNLRGACRKGGKEWRLAIHGQSRGMKAGL